MGWFIKLLIGYIGVKAWLDSFLSSFFSNGFKDVFLYVVEIGPRNWNIIQFFRKNKSVQITREIVTEAGTWLLVTTGSYLTLPNVDWIYEYLPSFLRWGETLNEAVTLIYGIFGVLFIYAAYRLKMAAAREKEIDIKIKEKKHFSKSLSDRDKKIDEVIKQNKELIRIINELTKENPSS